MTYDKQQLQAQADTYCQQHHSSISRILGFGTQGIVFQTTHNTALKVHARKEAYLRERLIYERLKERKVDSVRGLQIPRILNWDDHLCSFEMSIVHVPCVLDFGGAYLDEPPEHMSRDEMWTAQKSDEFGDHWEEAKAVIRELEHRADIWLVDVNNGNIKFTLPG
jgi:hypothetical protein